MFPLLQRYAKCQNVSFRTILIVTELISYQTIHHPYHDHLSVQGKDKRCTFLASASFIISNDNWHTRLLFLYNIPCSPCWITLTIKLFYYYPLSIYMLQPRQPCQLIIDYKSSCLEDLVSAGEIRNAREKINKSNLH